MTDEFEAEDESETSSDPDSWVTSAGRFELVGARIANYGPIRTCYVALDNPVTVFYGLNGAGKSNVLDALATTLSSQLIGDSVSPPPGSRWARPQVELWLQGEEFPTMARSKELNPWDPWRSLWVSFTQFVEQSRRDMRFEYPTESMILDTYNQDIVPFIATMTMDDRSNEAEFRRLVSELSKKSFHDVPDIFSFVAFVLVGYDEATLVASDGSHSGNESDLVMPLMEALVGSRLRYEVSSHKRAVAMCRSSDGRFTAELLEEVKKALTEVIWPDFESEVVKTVVSREVIGPGAPSERGVEPSGIQITPEQRQQILSTRVEAIRRYLEHDAATWTESLDRHFPYYMALTWWRAAVEDVLGIAETPVWASDTICDGENYPGPLPFVLLDERAQSTEIRSLAQLIEETQSESTEHEFNIPNLAHLFELGIRNDPRKEVVVDDIRDYSSLIRINEDGSFRVDDRVNELAEKLQEQASEIYSKVVSNAPLLSCKVSSFLDWPHSGPLFWSAVDRSGASVHLQSLSTAELRWAQFAIALADLLLTTNDSTQIVVIIDEPERALHRRAEHHLAASLGQLSNDLGVRFIVASHSPAFLSRRDFSLLHVFRDAKGLTQVQRVPENFHSRASELGLQPADLLQMCRLLLLVEGQHEVVVLEELIGPELRQIGVEVLCMRGAKALRAWDAQLVTRFTDAPFVVLTDNDDFLRLSAAWGRAKQAKLDGEEFFYEIDQLKSGSRGSEGEFLRELCKGLLQIDDFERFHLHAFEKADVTEYLPAVALAPEVGDKSWDLLRREAGERGLASGTFKSWLRDVKNARFDEATLRAAARSMDEIPEDFTSLLDRLAEIIRTSN